MKCICLLDTKSEDKSLKNSPSAKKTKNKENKKCVDLYKDRVQGTGLLQLA